MIRKGGNHQGERRYVILPGSEEEEGDHDHGEEGHHHEFDPHVWLSPVRAIKLEHIRDSLSADYLIKRDL